MIRPRKQRLIADIARRVQSMLESGYRDNRGDIDGYVSQLIHQAMEDTPEIRACVACRSVAIWPIAWARPS